MNKITVNSSSDEDDPYTNSVARLRGNIFSICDSYDLIMKAEYTKISKYK